jgi:hypothetical protein
MARPSAADRIADMAIDILTLRTRNEFLERELAEALQVIDDLTKALRRERDLNAAQCREDDRE